MKAKKPSIVMRGAVGLRKDLLDEEHLAHYKSRLTLQTIPFKDNPPVNVEAYTEDDDYLWVPRYFDKLTFWPEIKDWEWVAPHLDYKLFKLMEPCPKRRQPEAIEALVETLKRDSACIGVLPTGLGKTLTALEICRQFQTPIGIFVYAGHMIDNWVEHAQRHLGIPKEDIGLIKENRCDVGKPLTIISIQTALCRDLPKEAMEQFGIIVGDEIQRYGASAWSRVAAKFPARYRLGMSASPTRDDGLDPIIRWNFGKVGFAIHKRPTGELPLVCMVRYPSVYQESKYLDYRKIPGRNGGKGRWVPGSPNAMKYDKLLSKDKGRNTWLVDKMIEARAKGRNILVFARHRDHIKVLHDEFTKRYSLLRAQATFPETQASLLWGGIKAAERKRACEGQLIFTTHSYAREALNLTHLDTLIFASPAGDPLQPAGRLRDKGNSDRKSLLIIDPFEGNDYSFRKAMRRKGTYESLGMTVKRLKKS